MKWCFSICFAETPARPKSDISKVNGVWFWFSVSIYSMYVLVWKTVLLPCRVCKLILICVKCKQATQHCVISLCRKHYSGYWTAQLVLEKSRTMMCCRIEKVTKYPQLVCAFQKICLSPRELFFKLSSISIRFTGFISICYSELHLVHVWVTTPGMTARLCPIYS